MLRPLAVTGLALTLAACASGPRHDMRRHAPARGWAAGRLFVSPSGEPFRGTDGLAAWFARADANHDGALTAEEFQADAARFFRVLDANGDGVVDGFEAQAYEQTIAPEIAANDFDRPRPAAGERDPAGEDGAGHGGRRGGGGRGGRRGGRGMAGPAGGGPITTSLEGAARYSLIDDPEPVLNADADLDGKITRAEWRAATARRFAVLDKAKTGRLILDQLKALRGGERRRP
jgi:hypothetical protein